MAAGIEEIFAEGQPAEAALARLWKFFAEVREDPPD